MPSKAHIAICNLKGGTGKTTCAVNIAANLAFLGKKILLVDADPQCDCTEYFVDPNELLPQNTLESLYIEGHTTSASDLIHTTRISGLDLIPCSENLALISYKVASFSLNSILNEVSPVYDAVIIDTHPDLGVYTKGALQAATHVIVPLQPERAPVRGFARFWDTLNVLAEQISLLGVVCTQLDERGKSHKEWANLIKEEFGESFLGDIHRATIVNEAADRRLTLREVSTSARAYREMLALTKEIGLRLGMENGQRIRR